MAKAQNDNLAAVAAFLAKAGVAPAPAVADEPSAREPVDGADGRLETLVNGRVVPQAADPEAVDDIVLGFCAALDQSDTDNATRLIGHFGRNLRVMTQEKSRSALFVIWTGTHWDTATGAPRAMRLAQRLGDRIERELPMIQPSKRQQAAIDAADRLLEKPQDELTKDDQRILKLGELARDGLKGARKKRRDFAISSKNSARLKSMLDCVAPHVLTDPDAFNSDPFKVAVAGHTLRFAVETGTDEKALRTASLTAEPGHARADLITELVPASYREGADCPRWRAFLDEFLPNPEVRKMVQVAAGLGLLGVTVQKLFFHYGSGANGKSVFLEVICRVLGEAAVTLPAESFFGGPGQGGGATPDIARLHGRRFLRVQELPEGEALREDLVKKLTGGEAIAVRDLFQGYFDFAPIFVGHMSGNGYPKITGTDNGIWRRIAVVHWPVTIPVERQRDFEEVVSGFRAEQSGILNWLIDGALIYLEDGLQIPDAVAVETQKYRDEMDPTAGFVSRCVRPKPDEEVLARDLYRAYLAWAESAAAKPISETAFGRNMSRKFTREDGRVRRYVGITLVDLPESPSAGLTPDDYPDDYGGR